MTPARLLEVLRRILGRPPADWMGADPARAAARDAAPCAIENRHEVVALPGLSDADRAALARLAARGHRVFRVSQRAATGGRSVVTETEPGLFDVMLGPERFEGLDALRRERGLGATVCIAGGAEWHALARRLEGEFNWPTAADAAGDLAGAFPRLSIVVVTFDNRDLNRLCLDSVLARTEWPNLEVVVVDNGSTDGTRELLAGLAEKESAIRPILLDANRGFPAAANAGLSAADGRFLVLLNNDTVMLRGAFTALLRHLAKDPRLGLVGPSTNAIANAARVDAGYAGLEDMPGWAAAWMRSHDGERIAMPSLAFFCVAMPREVFETVGPLDERFGIGMFEDGDYCRRVRAAGLEIACARDSFVHHWQMASFRRLGREEYFRLFEENRRKFEAKWGDGGP